jgi:glycine cleavage system aminomethyltransferase T
MDSLRIEKAYRSWGHDLGGEDTPLEAGLGFAVRFDKPGGFVGRDALLRQREKPLTRRLVVFVLDDPGALPLGDEPIFCEGRIAGSVTSAAYGHTLGRAVAMGYVRHPDGVDAALLDGAALELDIAGERYKARGSFRAPYDPQSLRVRA